MAGVVIDPATNLPRVVPVRQNDGVLRFACEFRKTGGMAVLLDVPPEALSGARIDQSEEADLQGKLREAAKRLAAQLVGDPGNVPVGESEVVYAEREQRLAEAEAELEAARREAKEAKAVADQAVRASEAADDATSQTEVEIDDLRSRLQQAEEARAQAVAENERLVAEKTQRRAAEKPARPRPGSKRTPAGSAA